MPKLAGPRKGSRSSSSNSRRETKGKDKELSARTKKQIDSLPEHAAYIKKTHASSLEQYKNPEKRSDGKRQSPEQVAYKAAWAAVKKQYKKKGSQWIKEEEEEQ
jgi:cation transport regulator